MPACILRPARGVAVALLSLGLAAPAFLFAQDSEPAGRTLKELSLDELMNVEVTSVSKRPEKLLEAASAIQVVTGDEIRRSGASTIPEALRLAPNLDVAQKSAHEWAISARGFATELVNKLLVLIDGRTVYTPLYSGVYWDAQDYLLEDLDRIEVISGPGGTLWGANAVNGVINITTKEARETQGFFTEAGGGDPLHGFAGARYGGRLAPNVYFRVYGKYFDRGDETTTDDHPAHDGWTKHQGGFRLDADPSPADALTLQGDFYGGDEDLTTGGTSQTRGGNLLSRWSHVFANDSDVSVQVYYDRTHLSLAVPSFAFAPAGRFTDDLDTLDFDLQHHLRLGEHSQLVWGLGYRFTRDRVGNAAALSLFPARLQQNLFSGFAQDEIALPRNFVLTFGSKLEHNDYTGLEFEPSLRLQWNASSHQMFWAAVSRAVRTPSRIDRTLSEPAPNYPPVILRGSSDFSSESLVAVEAGWRSQLAPTAAASLSLFYNNYQNLRSTSLSPPDPVFGLPFPLYFANNLEGETYGAELGFTWQPLAWWRLRAGYTLLSESIRVKPGHADFSNTLNETADPGQQASLNSSLDLPHDFSADTQFRWVDSRVLNNSGVPALVPSYAELDLRVAWRANAATEFSLVGQNLLHPRHLEYGIPAANRAEIGRSIYGKVTWRF